MYFDIETLGKSPLTSSLVSIGYTNTAGKVLSLYGSPSPGSRIYSWTEKNIWRKIKEHPNLLSERQLLSGFIAELESRPGEELRGWNIGTAPSRHTQGFDIPFLLTRAKKYNLQERLTSALSSRPIRDIGKEYATAIALQVANAPESLQIKLDPDILRSTLVYAQAATDAKTALLEEGITPSLSNISQRVTEQRRFNLAGWKQEQIHELLGLGKYQAHEVAADVRALARIPDPSSLSLSPLQIETWSKGALESALLGQAKAGTTPYQELLERATRGGIAPRFEQKIAQAAKEAGIPLSNIISGKRTAEEWRYIGAKSLHGVFPLSLKDTAGQMVNFAKRRPGMIGLGVGAAALLFTEPLSWFSGKDDAYNTIEGLPHGGLAERMRRALTDFGSGYQGLPSSLMGQAIDPRILAMRAEVIDVPAEREKLRASLAEEQQIAQEALGVFLPSDFIDLDLSTIRGIRNRDRTLRAINLSNFRVNAEDADTLLLKRRGLSNISSDPIKVRLAGIDAPEVAGHADDPLASVRIFQQQVGGEKATAALQNFIENQDSLTLAISTGRKTYGRYLGVLANEDVNINLALLREGLVTALPFGPASEDILARRETEYAEQVARHQNLGLWSHARYKALREVNLQVGRVLTHNAITRLDKLAANLNFGAFGSFIESFGNARRPLTGEETQRARRIGRALRRTHGPVQNRFSGFDDAYNTIQGFQHEGMSSASRGFFGFGSGWIRKALARGISPETVATGIKRLTGFGAKGIERQLLRERNLPGILREVRSRAGVTVGKDFYVLGEVINKGTKGRLFDITKAYGPHGRIAAVKTVAMGQYSRIKRAYTAGSGVSLANPLLADIGAGAAAAGEMGIAEGVSSFVLRTSQEIQSTGLTALEYEAKMQRLARGQYGSMVPKVFGASKEQLVSEWAGPFLSSASNLPGRAGARAMKKMFGKHYSTLKPGQIAHLDPKIDQLVRRGGRIKVIDWGIAGPVSAETLGETRKLMSAVVSLQMKRLGNKFSGFDDVYNTIEGLTERGIAGAARKTSTDFGSGWRGILALPRELEKLFAKSSLKNTSSAGLTGSVSAFRKLAGKAIQEVGDETGEAARALKTFLGKAKSNPFEELVIVNRSRVQEVARGQGLSYRRKLKSVIAHERAHQASVQLGMREFLGDMFKYIPEKSFQKLFKKSSGYKSYSKELLVEEIIAHTRGAEAIGQEFFGPETRMIAKKLMGKWKYTNVIKSPEWKKFRSTRAQLQQQHASGTRQASINAFRGGKRHMHQAGRHIDPVAAKHFKPGGSSLTEEGLFGDLG